MEKRFRSSRARWLTGLVAALSLLATTGLQAQRQLRKSLADDEVAAHWVYDNLPRAMEQAKASGKPILALIRCVP